MKADADALGVAAAVLGDRAVRDAPLGARTTYRVGGTAALLLEVADDDDLALAGRAVRASGAPVLVVGRGSNLLVADAGFAGLAVVLGPAYEQVSIDGRSVRAGGAAPLPVLARRTAAAGLRGLEWAVGVPGSVGGAVRMNAGGHGSDMAATLVEVRAVDLLAGHDEVVPALDLDLGYRSSVVGPATVVVEAVFHLAPGDAREAGEQVADIVRWRREHQPGGQNAGSVFTNPVGDSAGRLVEEAGGRGLRIGSAEVSSKHANFIQADPDGRADDVAALIEAVRAMVRERCAVDLHPEVQRIGTFDLESRVR